MSVKYKCVHCGHYVPELFKQYSSSVLKLIQCGNCMKIADKYIEYDLVIIMIDLILLNKEAYRHILYNSPFQNHWKLAVILLLTEAYAEWVPHRHEQTLPTDVFEGERSFYWTCSQSVIGSAVFFAVVYALTYVRRPFGFSDITLWKALVLSSFGKFLLIPGLIWGVIGSETNSLFVMGYTLLSQMQAYSVVCNTSRLVAAVIISLGIICNLFTRHLLATLV